jgi:hypothetical protein
MVLIVLVQMSQIDPEIDLKVQQLKEILENQDLLVNLVVVQELGVDREDLGLEVDREDPGLEVDREDPGLEVDREDPGLEVDREDPGLEVDREDPGLEVDQVQIQVEDVIIVDHLNGNRN